MHTYYVLAGATPVLVHNCDDHEEGFKAAEGSLAREEYPRQSIGGAFYGLGDEPIELLSGGRRHAGRPNYTPPPGVTKNGDHIGAQSAAIMRDRGLKRGTVYLSNDGPCSMCKESVSDMLPSKSSLTVYWRKGGEVYGRTYLSRDYWD
ncbi:DddA-like double-stranded DNA deaminase toxin [Streptomyces sp. NPDC006393]|uniref:DddA-like double-stranded DNA deaminase toxin n=1 Tax=Streptomyces sp. NPDC006393 TaxID=3156763 RepID=UPI0033ED673B